MLALLKIDLKTHKQTIKIKGNYNLCHILRDHGSTSFVFGHVSQTYRQQINQEALTVLFKYLHSGSEAVALQVFGAVISFV